MEPSQPSSSNNLDTHSKKGKGTFYSEIIFEPFHFILATKKYTNRYGKELKDQFSSLKKREHLYLKV